ncbi:putative transposase, Tnp1/En/Spm [Helianthus annuus]|nr:putative transposase, Tnp1/En/Spm [Helianthus annuus]
MERLFQLVNFILPLMEVETIHQTRGRVTVGFLKHTNFINFEYVVGGTEIGPEWCEVNVQVPIKKDPIKKDENFVRPYGLFSTIQGCIGASIPWPYLFISVVNED